jgi:hypothetical protein
MSMQGAFILFRKIACRACILAGPRLLTIALGFAAYLGAFLHRSVSATGTLASLSPMHNDEGELYYVPSFTFAAIDGQTYTVTSNTGSNPPEFAVGQQVRVLYDPSNPHRAKIGTFVQLWIFPLCFGFSGLIAIIMGIFLLRLERQRNFAHLFSWREILQER